jgi:hypothetical protein
MGERLTMSALPLKAEVLVREPLQIPFARQGRIYARTFT